MTRWDKITIVLILCTSIISLVFINAFAYTNKADTLIIELDGEEYARYKLKDIATSEIVEIKSEHGYNKIQISRDGVAVIDADCDDKLDIKAGKITRANEYIVCLPHRLVIRLIGGHNYADAVAY